MNWLNKIAAALAVTIGVMAVVAGGKTLLGSPPGYSLVGWLPVYNLAVGAISAVLGIVLIWNNHRMALPGAVMILGVHSLVMLLLQTTFRQEVASESVMAMVIRIAIWVTVIILLLVQGKVMASKRHLA